LQVEESVKKKKGRCWPAMTPGPVLNPPPRVRSPNRSRRREGTRCDAQSKYRKSWRPHNPQILCWPVRDPCRAPGEIHSGTRLRDEFTGQLCLARIAGLTILCRAHYAHFPVLSSRGICRGVPRRCHCTVPACTLAPPTTRQLQTHPYINPSSSNYSDTLTWLVGCYKGTLRTN